MAGQRVNACGAAMFVLRYIPVKKKEIVDNEGCA